MHLQSLRDDLRDTVDHALSLHDRLGELTHVKSRQPSGTFHGKVDFSQPPWHAPAASAFLALHALARKLERDMRHDLGLPPRERGSSPGNTRKALEAVISLAEKADDDYVRMNARELERWSRSAGIALNEIEIPKRLPRQAGEAERPCPWCKLKTLRMCPFNTDGHGEIRCINGKCKDDQGRRPSAVMEFFAGEMVLRWMDGVIGTP